MNQTNVLLGEALQLTVKVRRPIAVIDAHIAALLAKRPLTVGEFLITEHTLKTLRAIHATLQAEATQC